MGISSHIRQIQISLIIDTPNPIIDLFNDIWYKLSIVETDAYHQNGDEFIYFISGDQKKWIFYRDDINDIFWCNYEEYWLLFETNFNLNYDEIQELTKLLVENALNNVLTTPLSYSISSRCLLEKALNNMLTTPDYQYLTLKTMMFL